MKTFLLIMSTLTLLSTSVHAQRCDYATSTDPRACLQQNLREARKRANGGKFGAWEVTCHVDRMHDAKECQARNDGLVIQRSQRFNHLWIFVVHGETMPGSWEYVRVDKGKVWSIETDDGGFPRELLGELRRGKVALLRSTHWPDSRTIDTEVDLTGLGNVLDYMEAQMRTR